jgi:hypothetical protein
VRIFDYFKNRSMPEFAEPLVAGLVKLYSSGSDVLRTQLISAVSREPSPVYGWYARKAAGRAVRHTSQEDIFNGLISLALSAGGGDFRDCVAPLALLHNSALLLGSDPATIFGTICEILPSQTGGLFKSFQNRAPDQKSPKLFGFHEGTGPLGFDYVPLLPEYGGPTPLK